MLTARENKLAIVIAAGGTGGHINPGISIAEEWIAQGGKVVFATLSKNIDYPDIASLARNKAVSIVAYDAPRLEKKPWRWISFFRRFISAYRLLQRVARAEQAVAVVGMGGYSSFPAVLYAVANRLPLFLCEQNAHWGIVTRLMRFFARRVFLSFVPAKKYSAKYVVTGNPLRAIFAKVKVPKARRKSPKTIFFIGGSQGAQDINALYLAFIKTAQAKKFHCLVAAGPKQYEELSERARQGDVIRPFVTEMPQALLNSDYVVARCGSGTLAELLWANRPAFLIPYPYAADDHQRKNAESIRGRLCCVIYDERPFQSERALAALLDFLAANPNPLHSLKSSRANLKTASAAQAEIVRYIKEELRLTSKA